MFVSSLAASGANKLDIWCHSQHDPDANAQTWYDNVVDISDLATLVSEWLDCNDPENLDCI